MDAPFALLTFLPWGQNHRQSSAQEPDALLDVCSTRFHHPVQSSDRRLLPTITLAGAHCSPSWAYRGCICHHHSTPLICATSTLSTHIPRISFSGIVGSEAYCHSVAAPCSTFRWLIVGDIYRGQCKVFMSSRLRS